MTTNKVTRRFAWRLVPAFVIVLTWAACAAAQTVVVGTSNPDIDVPAVQAAVDQGGEVILRGHFSFDRPPTIPTALQGYPPAMVLVSKAVTISGARDERDHDREMTTIEAGTIPFYVEAPGAAVTIQELRFVRPKSDAVLVYTVSGLVIASCKMEGVEPVDHFSTGIEIDTVGAPPTPANPGKPENISGTLVIAGNEIDVPGTSLDNTLGIVIFSVGVPGAEVGAYISRNTVTNSTERAINLYQIGGRAYIEGNVITTSTIMGTAHVLGCRGTDVIHVTGIGAYLVARNSVHSYWAAGAGIRVQGQQSVWPIIKAVVVDNEINMEAPEGAVFDECSAGIDIFGFAKDSVVLGNRIRGRSGVALAVRRPGGGSPNNAFVLNRFDDFTASLVDIFVADGVMNTHIVGQGTIEDHGVGTVIEPVPF